MGMSSRLFSGLKRLGASASARRYSDVAGETEFSIREALGESLAAEIEQIHTQWTPGNEYLWDGIDVELLIDCPEKRELVPNQFLYARVTLYRALRSQGRDIRGLDPFAYALEVPDMARDLADKFPDALKGGRLFEVADVRGKQPAIKGRSAALEHPEILERVVRAAIGDHFDVDPATVQMDQPLCDEPLGADDLDLLELGWEISERLEIPIPKHRWPECLYSGAQIEAEAIRLTPAGLIKLYQDVGRTL
jgi:acyl carrier protein